ncbi:hypothetical protein D7X32_19940 [Corallococcus carmarthensis]|uniref:Uncharacterized protein n=1 Tax=Corallococcus carmarthensis TaxID=2316728 RepID=A0A3A8K2I8_9BACT|nr:hypothetical protein D7X32_19940 [Corallococcus carmarthensis]
MHARDGPPRCVFVPAHFRPHRTSAFTGFAEGQRHNVDAAMLVEPDRQNGGAGADALERTPKVASRNPGEDKRRGRPRPLSSRGPSAPVVSQGILPRGTAPSSAA